MVALRFQCANTRTRRKPDRFDEYFAKERMQMYQSSNLWSLDEANRIERNKTDENEQMLLEMFMENCQRSAPEIYENYSSEEWKEFCRRWSNNIAAGFDDELSSEADSDVQHYCNQSTHTASVASFEVPLACTLDSFVEDSFDVRPAADVNLGSVSSA